MAIVYNMCGKMKCLKYKFKIYDDISGYRW